MLESISATQNHRKLLFVSVTYIISVHLVIHLRGIFNLGYQYVAFKFDEDFDGFTHFSSKAVSFGNRVIWGDIFRDVDTYRFNLTFRANL